MWFTWGHAGSVWRLQRLEQSLASRTSMPGRCDPGPTTLDARALSHGGGDAVHTTPRERTPEVGPGLS